MTVETPTVRAATRKWGFWVAAGAFAIVIVLVLLAIRGVATDAALLSPTSAAPNGSKAIAQVLGRQGVTVTPTTGFAQTRTVVRGHADATVFVVDRGGYLSGDRLKELIGSVGHLVVMTPTFDQLQDFAPEVAHGGSVTGTLKTDCALPEVVKAQTVTGDGSGFRLVDTTADATRCLGSGDGIFSLIELNRGDTRVSIVGTVDAFTNEHVAERGNAAFALNLLGASDTLAWYEPSIDDATVAGAPTIQDLTPQVVTPVIALLMLVSVAAAFWRGRRLGPLVIENLPVTVRASETMEGRARLYQKSSARTRALDTLRLAAVARIAQLCGLGRLATVEDVIVAASEVTSLDARMVRGILLDESPTGDADLIRLSDALRRLELAVSSAVRPENANRTAQQNRQGE